VRLPGGHAGHTLSGGTVIASRVLRKTKVIATIGPACDSVETIGQMIEAGMNVARLNLSHGTLEEHRARIERVRQASETLCANVAVMLDTKGMEIRTGTVRDGSVELEEGAPFLLFVKEEPGDHEGVSVSHKGLPREVKLGSRVLLDDGRIELRVVSLDDESIRCQVVRGGELGNRVGLNVPETPLSTVGMTESDWEDLRFAVENDVDYIAASFVRSAEDVREIRRFLQGEGADLPIIAKIENREGVEHLDEIVAEANGTMVARGDLGVELAVEEVPLVQKRIIRSTVMSGKPVITATQMLDSMERNSRPTRAEASDVANAILDGTSAVMLSGETARGRYPVDAVRTMASLAFKAEASLREYGTLQRILPEPGAVVTEAVAQAAITMARHLEAAAILTLTESGFTSRAISKYRPDCPILAITTTPGVVRKLAMNWGVTAMLYDGTREDEAEIRFGLERARQLGVARPGDVVVATAGISGETGSTNLIRVVRA
jgi:pyruvate kinase